MTARVGIVIRTRHRPEFLRRALRDVRSQTFPEWQVVVVNDGGDATEVDGIIAAESTADRVSVIHIADGEGGRCRAANAGVSALEADYVVLHDDDDLWHPEFLARTASWLDAHAEHAGVAATTEIVYEERRGDAWVEVGRAPFWAGMQRLSLTAMMSVNRVVPIAMLYRRSVHADVGWYDESLDAVEDWDLYLRILSRGELGFLVGEPLAFWTQRPQATGLDANSMFALADAHAVDDARVRDRALAEWVSREGVGIPLYLAQLQNELVHHLDRRMDELRADVRADVRHEIDSHQPLWSRVRALRRHLRR